MVDDEEVLSECSAAMLLMKLSCSPAAAAFPPPPFYADLPSPSGSDNGGGSSSGMSSAAFRSATPSPPLSSSTATTDEGIDLRTAKSQPPSAIIYQCTFPGCRVLEETVRAIEAHVRVEHLRRPAEEKELREEERDGEEEFYYTELEADGGEGWGVGGKESSTCTRPEVLNLVWVATQKRVAKPFRSGPREGVRWVLWEELCLKVGRCPNRLRTPAL